MTKIPRVSGNAMIRYAAKKGFVILRQKGSHVRLRKGSAFTTITTGNGPLKVGTLMGVLNDMRIDRDEFIKDHGNGLVK